MSQGHFPPGGWWFLGYLGVQPGVSNQNQGLVGDSNLQRRIHAGGGRVLEQRKSTGVRTHTTPQVGADGKPAEAPYLIILSS